MAAALGRSRPRRIRRMDGDGSFSDAAASLPPAGGPYVNQCFLELVAHAEDVSESSFGGRAHNWPSPEDVVYQGPPCQELYHDGRVAARGVADVDCTLVPSALLPSRFVAVQLRSLGADPDTVPCWAWGDGVLTETMLNVVSLHTLVWQTRMTGYAVYFFAGSLVCSFLVRLFGLFLTRLPLCA